MTSAHAASRTSRAAASYLLPLHEPELSEELVRLNRRGMGSGVLIAVLTLAAVALLEIGGATPQVSGAQGPGLPQVLTAGDAETTVLQPQAIREAYGRLPLIFEANQGQTDPQVRFLARGGGYGLFLTSSEVVLALQAKKGGAGVVRMTLAGANDKSAVAGVDPLPGRSHYLLGSNPAKWRRNIPQFARVRYREVYPGVDLVYYGNQGRLEYDFEVSAGSDPQPIAIHFTGSDNPRLTAAGDLAIATADSEVLLHAPQVYQVLDGEKKLVTARFAMRGGNTVGFELGSYDRRRALVIDPVLTYSTFLGGTGAETSPKVAVDPASNAYVAVTTTSATFPVPASTTPYQPTLKAGAASNVLITKIGPAGAAVLVMTYIGGTGMDVLAGVGVDANQNVLVAGTTSSGDFPTQGGFQTTPGSGPSHVFVSELNSALANLLYSTYLSGNGADTATGLAVDIRNRAFITGTTTSTNFPTSTGAYQTTRLATNQFFVSKVDPALTGASSLVFSTYFGGATPSTGAAVGGGIAVDASSNAYITGGTSFQHTGVAGDFPILNASQNCLNAPTNPSPCTATNPTSTDAFVAKFNPSATGNDQLKYSTYVGGGGDDIGNAIGLDSTGNAYVTGSTNSTDVPIASGITPFQKCLDDPTNPTTCATGATALDAFVAKINNPTSAAVTQTYFSYIGGTGADVGLAIAVDPVQGALVTGSTDSADFHTMNPLSGLGTLPAGTHGFVTRVDTTSSKHYSTYLGGSGSDRGTGIAIDVRGASYVTGETTSADFPHVAALQPTPGGSTDAFLSKLGPTVSLAMTAASTPAGGVGVGNQATFTYTITNNGDPTPNIVFADTLSDATATFVSATTSPGSCGTPTGTPATVTCSIGTLNAGATATVTVGLSPTEAGSLLNSATVGVLGGTTTPSSASASIVVSDFAVSVAPDTQTTPAGTPVTYTVTASPVSPSTTFPNSISISCATGLPTGGACDVTDNPISNLSTGAQTRSITVNTTARTTSTSSLRHNGGFYALWLPISGLAFLGFGLGVRKSSARRAILGLILGAFLGSILLQAGCGSDSSTTTTTTGTPAGTYTVTVSAKSGTVTHSQPINLVVQ